MQGKNQKETIDSLKMKIQSKLTPDLLKPEYKSYNKFVPAFGHCYVASEALYHLSGGKASGLSVKRARDDFQITHWWLEDSQGNIFDPTADQYRYHKIDPPYSRGVKTGFLTKSASKRAMTLIKRVLT